MNIDRKSLGLQQIGRCTFVEKREVVHFDRMNRKNRQIASLGTGSMASSAAEHVLFVIFFE